MIKKIVLAVTLFSLQLSVQAQKKYKWSDVVKQLNASDTSALEIKPTDSLIIDVNLSTRLRWYSADSAKRAVVNRKVIIDNPKLNCKHPIAFSNLRFMKSVKLKFLNSEDDNRFELDITGCLFEKLVRVEATNSVGNAIVFIVGFTNCVFKHQCPISVTGCATFDFSYNEVKLKEKMWCLAKDVVQVFIIGNNFDTDFTIINQNDGWVDIDGNKFHKNTSINGAINTGFTLRGNVFEKSLVLQHLSLPAKSIIDWDDVKLKIAVKGDTSDLYFGGPADHLKNKNSYKELISTYKSIYDSYKSRGDIESANECFVAVKDIEGNHLRERYNTEGGFKNYFAWKLNRLMKLYTNHATEPALALVISIYILFGFAIFYFFFPSEWDAESKLKLIQHYKDFIQKNDKGYVRPFLKLVVGFVISFINAFTLSLNSFVTLGFGNIPTKGLARYVCIIQGFIGWFLLSIFTVALFNQVLF